MGPLLLAPAVLAAQATPPVDSSRALLLEHRFGAGLPDSTIVTLERGVMYWVEVNGPGTPAFLPVRRSHWRALVAPADDGEDRETRLFEVHAGDSGPYALRLFEFPNGAMATVRLYRDHIETRRFAELRDRDLAVGLSFAGGVHSGYRLDPTGGANPRGGTDVEGCILAQTGGWFSACMGVGSQTFPDARFEVTWFFLEPRARLASGRLLSGRRTDLGVALRLAQGIETGPRHISPSLAAVGLYATQHLSAEGRRRGWSLHAAWQHGRLGNVPETERLDTDRFTAGISWVP